MAENQKTCAKGIDKSGTRWYNSEAVAKSVQRRSLKIEQRREKYEARMEARKSPVQRVKDTDLAILKENTTQTKVSKERKTSSVRLRCPDIHLAGRINTTLSRV